MWQHELSFVSLVLLILTSVSDGNIILICIYLMVTDVEHFPKCFSATKTAKNSVFRSLPIFNWVIEFVGVQFLGFLIYLGHQPSVRHGIGENILLIL